MIPLTPIFFYPGAGGVASQSPIPMLRPFRSFQWTITALGGFESARLVQAGALEDVPLWFNERLMSSVAIFGPDADSCWEGIIIGVDATIGQERHSISIDPVANAVKVRFTTATGVGGAYPTLSTFSSDTTSQGIYGTKQAVISSNAKSLTDAGYDAASFLNTFAYPRSRAQTTVATGEIGEIEITLIAVGRYHLLDWLTTSSTTTSPAVTTAQIETLVTAYNTVNDFFSEDFDDIEASGRSVQQNFELDTTYKERIEQLLSFGNSSNQRMVGGVYENARFIVNTWAGASPSTIHYRRHLSNGLLTTPSGAIVYPWQVRPDRMLETAELLDVAPTTAVPDGAARRYIERVSFYADDTRIGVDLEPEESNDFTALIAYRNRGGI